MATRLRELTGTEVSPNFLLGLAVHVVPGDHVSMNVRPQVDEMGRKLRVWLDRVERA